MSLGDLKKNQQSGSTGPAAFNVVGRVKELVCDAQNPNGLTDHAVVILEAPAFQHKVGDEVKVYLSQSGTIPEKRREIANLKAKGNQFVKPGGVLVFERTQQEKGKLVSQWINTVTHAQEDKITLLADKYFRVDRIGKAVYVIPDDTGLDGRFDSLEGFDAKAKEALEKTGGFIVRAVNTDPEKVGTEDRQWMPIDIPFTRLTIPSEEVDEDGHPIYKAGDVEKTMKFFNEFIPGRSSGSTATCREQLAAVIESVETDEDNKMVQFEVIPVSRYGMGQFFTDGKGSNDIIWTAIDRKVPQWTKGSIGVMINPDQPGGLATYATTEHNWNPFVYGGDLPIGLAREVEGWGEVIRKEYSERKAVKFKDKNAKSDAEDVTNSANNTPDPAGEAETAPAPEPAPEPEEEAPGSGWGV